MYTPSLGTQAVSFEIIGHNMLSMIREGLPNLRDDDIVEEIVDLARPLRTVSVNSKSGQVFLISGQQRFIIKTISDGEATALIEILPKYVDHIIASGGASLLGRYIGLYLITVGERQKYVTVMHSIFDIPYQVTAMYDLNGSTRNRSVKDASETVRKDNGWIADGRRLRLSTEAAQRLLHIHAQDTTFLRACNVMGYSMLVGIAQLNAAESSATPSWRSADQSEAYCMGIIDFLVQFRSKKKAEHLMHVVEGTAAVASVTQPALYAERQQKFVLESMLPTADGTASP